MGIGDYNRQDEENLFNSWHAKTVKQVTKIERQRFALTLAVGALVGALLAYVVFLQDVGIKIKALQLEIRRKDTPKMPMKIAAYSDNGIWGIGDTEEQARAEAEGSLKEERRNRPDQVFTDLRFARIEDNLKDEIMSKIGLDSMAIDSHFVPRDAAPFKLINDILVADYNTGN